MKILYDSKTDDLDTALRQVRDNVLMPGDMRFLILQETWGDPVLAVGTPYQGSVYRHDLRIDHLPGLRVEELFQNYAYDKRQPCTAVRLYCDETELLADTEHAYGHARTVIRFVPTEKRDRLWEYFGRDNRESWDELMKHTVPVPGAMPAILSITRKTLRAK